MGRLVPRAGQPVLRQGPFVPDFSPRPWLVLCTTVFRAGVPSGCGAGPAIAVANARIRDSRDSDARARHRRQRRDFHGGQRRPAARAAVPRHRSGGPRLHRDQDRDQGQPLGGGVSRSRRAQSFPRSAGGLSSGSRRGDRWRSVARAARGRVRHARVLRGRRHAGGTGPATLVGCADGQAGRPQPRRLARPVSRRPVRRLAPPSASTATRTSSSA